MTESKPRVLCVDDEPAVLDGLRRTMRREFDVVTALSGRDGLDALAADDTFAVVTSDLRMPEMDGIEFLRRVRVTSPSVTRILLTGNADLEAATAAVNEGNVFRFLSKPCPAAVLVAAISNGIAQHRLVTAERVLLQETLLGSVKMLSDVLALANPFAFGRTNRINQRAGAVAEKLGTPARWEMEMAAMLSQAAYITLPMKTLDKVHTGENLTPEDQAMVDRLPEISESLVADIPRIENVKAILAQRSTRAGDVDALPMGCQILQTVIALDVLESQGIPVLVALDVLREQGGPHTVSVLDALESLEQESGSSDTELRELSLAELKTGMTLVDPVETPEGRLLVARGQAISVGLKERLMNFNENIGVKQPVRVLVPRSLI